MKKTMPVVDLFDFLNKDVITKQGLKQELRFFTLLCLHPHINISLACLQNCFEVKYLIQYTDTTAGEYLDQQLKHNSVKINKTT